MAMGGGTMPGLIMGGIPGGAPMGGGMPGRGGGIIMGGRIPGGGMCPGGGMATPALGNLPALKAAVVASMRLWACSSIHFW